MAIRQEYVARQLVAVHDCRLEVTSQESHCLSMSCTSKRNASPECGRSARARKSSVRLISKRRLGKVKIDYSLTGLQDLPRTFRSRRSFSRGERIKEGARSGDSAYRNEEERVTKCGRSNPSPCVCHPRHACQGGTYSSGHMARRVGHQLSRHVPTTCGARGGADEWIVHSYVRGSPSRWVCC